MKWSTMNSCFHGLQHMVGSIYLPIPKYKKKTIILLLHWLYLAFLRYILYTQSHFNLRTTHFSVSFMSLSQISISNFNSHAFIPFSGIIQPYYLLIYTRYKKNFYISTLEQHILCQFHSLSFKYLICKGYSPFI